MPPSVARLAVIVAVSALSFPTSPNTIAAEHQGPTIYRIMPVGDSITEGGKEFACYRYPLLKKLRDAGYRAEYVGSKQSTSSTGSLRHEAYGGKTAEFLAATVGRNFRDHPADIVLLHCGHNHFADEHPVPKIIAAIETMITSFRAANPRVIVLIAKVIPSGKLPKYSYIPELNEEITKTVKRLDNQLQPVIVVDQAAGFDWTKDTIDDKVHPNGTGADKMAARWFEALQKVMVKPGHEAQH